MEFSVTYFFVRLRGCLVLAPSKWCDCICFLRGDPSKWDHCLTESWAKLGLLCLCCESYFWIFLISMTLVFGVSLRSCAFSKPLLCICVRRSLNPKSTRGRSLLDQIITTQTPHSFDRLQLRNRSRVIYFLLLICEHSWTLSYLLFFLMKLTQRRLHFWDYWGEQCPLFPPP